MATSPATPSDPEPVETHEVPSRCGLVLCLLAVALVAAAVLTGAGARADGDPASDVLLGENVFYPYSPPVAPALQKTLNAEATAASRAHFPIKIALIASPTDLGVVPDLFGNPQRYANFLDQEISFQRKQRLLVVMPAGYGVQGLPKAAASTAGALPKPSGSRSNDLAAAAIAAIPKLAAAAGDPIHNDLPPPSTGKASSSKPILLALLATAAVLVTAALIAFRVRQSRTR